MIDATAPAALDLRGIVKRFDGVPALRGASLRVTRGTVHGLIGQNGAGKSTLIKILAGIVDADEGSIAVNGSPRPLAARTARHLPSGIEFIHQERLLAPTFTVAEAMLLGAEPARGPRAAGRLRLLDVRRMHEQASAALHEYFGVSLPPNRLIAELSVAEQQIVQITRALMRDPQVLVLDEPTAALVSREVQRLLETLDRLRQRGLTILFVSHYLNEVTAVCDRVTVLRDGIDVAEVDARTTSPEALVKAMIGNEAASRRRTGTRQPGKPVLQTHGLSAPGRFEDISLSVRQGEIVGITGLLGSGGKPFVRALFGLGRRVHGAIHIDGKPVRLRRPYDAVRHGIAFVPEDRRAHGVAPAMSVRENITLASLGRFTRFGLLSARRENTVIRELVDTLQIRTPGLDAPVRHLSGGNQQKVVLAKWLSRERNAAASLFLLDEPTVGVDVGAKQEIYRLLDRLADAGAAILVVSSDLDELLEVADRVCVMARGRIVHEAASDATDSQTLLAWATLARNAAETVREHAA
jgi:ribose transport system ATP-binding protein